MRTRRLDKRLRPAKVLGIILFFLSIVGFAGSVSIGVMSVLMSPFTNNVHEQQPMFSDTMDWIFRHYTLFAFSFSLFWIPLFFSARALYRFKEWGRIMCIIMLFLMMVLIAGMAWSFLSNTFAPPFFKIFSAVAFSGYFLVPAVVVFFLMRKSTRDGIKDYNLKTSANSN